MANAFFESPTGDCVLMGGFIATLSGVIEALVEKRKETFVARVLVEAESRLSECDIQAACENALGNDMIPHIVVLQRSATRQHIA